jgi:putative SOS response-associated peptidase YedK
MCGRFSILNNKTSLEKHFALNDSDEFINSYNVTPSDKIPVIRLYEGERQLVNCQWGFIPHWAKDDKFKPINAKAETLDEKPFFRSAFKNNRCLIPASGFYEWKGQKGNKQPWYIRLQDSELFAFAGLWDHWQNENKDIDSCTIITTNANAVMASIHQRMPVILDPGQYDIWLNDGDKDVLAPYRGKLICYPVSKKVNKPGSDGEELIRPL